MPERRRPRAVAALAGGLLAVVLTGPVALAQSDGIPTPPELDPGQETPIAPSRPEQHPPGSWGGSSFEAPFDEPDVSLRRETFDVEGTLRYEKTGPADFIEEVEVRVVDDPDDAFTPADGCTLPAPAAFSGDGPEPGLTAEQDFLVERVTVPCNGRYVVEAEGRLEDPDDSYTMRQSFVVAAMPASVTGLGVTFDGDDRSVTVTFQPLAEADLTPDAIGYVLERSGDDGVFVDVGAVELGDDPEFVDPLTDAPAGAYTYRVRAVRAGVDGEVRSSIIDTETDTVEVEGDPAPDATSTTSTVRSAATSSRSSGGRIPLSRSTSAPRLTTPTTLDTGFEDTLDYGDRGDGEGEIAGDEPVAGQSIVRDEAEGMGLAVPAAGALVMLGWAGHILYLNRLAKQL